jgi:hypothetical protein
MSYVILGSRWGEKQGSESERTIGHFFVYNRVFGGRIIRKAFVDRSARKSEWRPRDDAPDESARGGKKRSIQITTFSEEGRTGSE